MICDDCAFAARPSYKYPCSSCNMDEGSPGCKYEKIADNSKYTFALDNEGFYIYKDGKELVAIKPIPSGVELSGEGVKSMKMPKYKRMPTLEEMKQKYGKPTVSEAVHAFYLLAGLCDLANECEYLHNFQLERSDIVEYVYRTHEILRVLKGDKT